MSWASATASTATWVAGSSTAKTWSGQTVSPVPPPWAPLGSRTTTVDIGIDFALRITNVGGFYLSTDRSLVLREYDETI